MPEAVFNNCCICETKLDVEARFTPLSASQIECPRCGTFIISPWELRTWGLILDSHPNSDRARANLSAWVRENQGLNPPSFFSEGDIKQILATIRTPSFHERADKLLVDFEIRTRFIGQEISVYNNRLPLEAISWCINDTECAELLKYLRTVHWITGYGRDLWENIKIDPEGWSHLEKLKSINPDSQQGFVAMWFNDELKPIFEQDIGPAIIEAGYKPLRVDMEHHIDKIDDYIVSQIRQSKFIVADSTAQRQSVYFEAGFAYGLNIPVFWTCKQEEIDQDKIAFDTRQYNCLGWVNPGDLKERLRDRIIANLGKGQYKSDNQ